MNKLRRNAAVLHIKNVGLEYYDNVTLNARFGISYYERGRECQVEICLDLDEWQECDDRV